jgi:hypothetical protein
VTISSSEKPIRWWGVLAGMGIFLLPIIGSIGSPFINETVAIAIRLLLIAFILAVFLFGIFKGLARWCLPTVGLFLGALWMYGGLQLIGSWLLPWMNNFVRGVNASSRYTWQAIMDGVFWGGLLIISMAFVLICLLLPPLRLFYRRARSDWTLVSFTLFGATLFALFIDWDEYAHEEVFVALSYAFLAFGAAGYLLSKTKTARMIWLLSAVTLAMVTMAVGKFILVPMQDWPMWFQWHSSESERWFESLRSLIELGWILLALLAPYLLLLLPPAKELAVETPGSANFVLESSADSAPPR